MLKIEYNENNRNCKTIWFSADMLVLRLCYCNCLIIEECLTLSSRKSTARKTIGKYQIGLFMVAEPISFVHRSFFLLPRMAISPSLLQHIIFRLHFQKYFKIKIRNNKTSQYKYKFSSIKIPNEVKQNFERYL